MGTGLHRHHRTGNTGVDGRGDKRHGLADLLAHGHLVTHSHAGLAGRTDMHGHGDYNLRGGRQFFDGLFVGGGFLVIGMDAAEKGLCHFLHLVIF